MTSRLEAARAEAEEWRNQAIDSREEADKVGRSFNEHRSSELRVFGTTRFIFSPPYECIPNIIFLSSSTDNP